MKRPVSVVAFPFLLVFVAASSAQRRAPAPPVATSRHLLALDQLATVELPPIPRGEIHKEDAQREHDGLPPRFALPREHRLTPDRAGTWEDLDRDTLLWRLRIRAPGSVSLNLGFGRYHMPAGGRLSVHSADGVHVVAPFTDADNEPHGELWTPVVLTDDLVVELALPAAVAHELELELTWINQGYRGFGAPTTAFLSGSCNVDVVCPQGVPWQLEIPSVGVISTGGSTFCTGFLVNNVAQDLRPYFMTANHCGITSGNAASLVVYWNYENSTCRPPGSGSSGGPGDGSLAQFNTGSFFRSAYAPSDFTLVELDDAIDPDFAVSYAGWDATGDTGASAVAIHHPNTDEKRISFEDQPTSTTSYLAETVPGDGTHVRVTDWDLGTTEPGSSGSPLFDDAHRVIGQLHGGFASCTSQTSDWYGKFSVSWTGGGSNASRLRNWLDPANTGTLVLDTVSLGTLCSDEGSVELERDRFSCSDDATVEVVDCDLNASSALVETVLVTVSSDSEPAGETLLLTETSAASAHFSGTIALSGTDGAGVLWVGEGDQVVASYVDADDGQGGTNVLVTDSATVDCTPPGVLSIGFSGVTATEALLTVQADEDVLLEAQFGATCGAPTGAAFADELANPAAVQLAGLLPSTTYFVRVLASDEAGNTTVDDNGGLCHSFTTLEAPLYFTEEFLGDNDLDAVAIVLRPSPGPDGYTMCRRAISALPTDPAGGTPISLSDDGSFSLALTGGQQVQLYGSAYSSFWVNANGNLTFTALDGDYTESLEEHFAVRRVAAVWDDLNPSVGGSVTRKQLSDRVAVTWQNVPEYSTSNQNTFQIEMFFDGTIRLSYLSVAATDGITGLSRGVGLDPEFIELDLSNAPVCSGVPDLAPRADPTAARTVTTQ